MSVFRKVQLVVFGVLIGIFSYALNLSETSFRIGEFVDGKDSYDFLDRQADGRTGLSITVNYNHDENKLSFSSNHI